MLEIYNRLQGDKDISLSVDEQKNIKSNFTPKTKEQREKVANFKTAYIPKGGTKNYITDGKGFDSNQDFTNAQVIEVTGRIFIED